MLNLDKPHLTPAYDLVANLVYCAKPSDVETVMVDGRIVVGRVHWRTEISERSAVRSNAALGVLQRRGSRPADCAGLCRNLTKT